MKYFSIFVSLVLAVLMTSCGGQKGTAEESKVLGVETQVFNFADSCKHVMVSVALEVPVGDDSISAQIRRVLVADFVNAARQPGYHEDESTWIKPFQGDTTDIHAMVDYYGKAGYEYLLKDAKSDYDQKVEFLEEDTTIAEEDKEMIRNDVPLWAYEFSTKKVTDTLNVMMFYSQIYAYFGGAHGGVVGTGAMTFDKENGKWIKSFLKPDATEALQPVIRKGLIRYYSEAGDTITDQQLSERLQIEGTMIPLPRNAPYLNDSCDSLVLTYGQYEIACYADGMPSFMVPLKELMPYLTTEGKELIDAIRINPVAP